VEEIVLQEIVTIVGAVQAEMFYLPLKLLQSVPRNLGTKIVANV
jgi:hypothetical protein